MRRTSDSTRSTSLGALAAPAATARTFFVQGTPSGRKAPRSAFVQGGDDGLRLVFVTPQVTGVKTWITFEMRDQEWVRICEVKWKPVEMPIKYENVPMVV